MRKILSSLVFLAAYLSFATAQDQDVFVPIGKYIQKGDSEKLAA